MLLFFLVDRVAALEEIKNFNSKKPIDEKFVQVDLTAEASEEMPKIDVTPKRKKIRKITRNPNHYKFRV